MLVKDHGEVEDPELMDVRHLRRNSTRAGLDLHSDGTSPIDKGHASLASIFDLGDVATPAPARGAAGGAGAGGNGDVPSALPTPLDITRSTWPSPSKSPETTA